MLGYIEGKIISKNPETLQCIVLNQGIGYEVQLARPIFDKTALHTSSQFWLHTIVREDLISFFGFELEVEKHFFKLLLSVSGLGPKTALVLIGEFGPDAVMQMILSKDAAGLSKAPGIGKKTAERICLDLKTKLEKWSWATHLDNKTKESPVKKATAPVGLKEDLSSALQNLGYSPISIKSTIDMLFDKAELEKLSFEECLKMSLKELSSHTLTTPREPSVHG